jgi:hypothetical protein
VKNLYDAAIATEMLYLSTAAYAQNQQMCLAKLPLLAQNSWQKYGDFSNSQCDIANSTCFGYLIGLCLSYLSLFIRFSGNLDSFIHVYSIFSFLPLAI